MPEEIARLDRQSATLRRGIERLIDSYAEGVIEKSEFTPRIAGLKQRLSARRRRYSPSIRDGSSSNALTSPQTISSSRLSGRSKHQRRRARDVSQFAAGELEPSGCLIE